MSRGRKLFELRRWDEALCVAEVAKNAAFATEAIEAALDDLLAAGRTSSLQRWVAAARSAGAEGGLIDYAESEALLRADELDAAIALARRRRGPSMEICRARTPRRRQSGTSNGPLRAGRRPRGVRRAARKDSWRLARERSGCVFSPGMSPRSTDLRDRLDEFKSSALPGVQQSLNVASGDLALAEFEGNLEQAIDGARCALLIATERGATRSRSRGS